MPRLARAAGASGFFNVVPDRDGMLRRVPLLIGYRGGVYPSLALAALLSLVGSRGWSSRGGGSRAAGYGSAGRGSPSTPAGTWS